MRLNGIGVGRIFGWAFVLLALAGCNKGGSVPTTSIPGESGAEEGKGTRNSVTHPVQLTADPNPGDSPARAKANLFPEVLIQTTAGDIKVRLNLEKAPTTVDNFLSNYVSAGFYEGTVIHYVDNGFMVAAGGYTATLAPKPTHTPVRNEAHNGLTNKKGTIAMARHPESAHSATSQFFFNLVDNSVLDHKSRDTEEEYGYCVFGEVIEGWDVVERIAAVEVRDTPDFPKTPVTPIIIKAIQRLN